MKKIHSVVAASLLMAGALGASQVAQAGSGNCPTGVDLTGNTNYVQFDDVLSYSLPILGIDVNSSPGQIGGCIIITSGPGGVLSNTGGGVTMDNAYNNENGSQFPYFQTGSPVNTNAPDPGGAPEFTNDSATTWDISVAALEAFLNGGTPIIYFNHNQTNSGSTIDQDLFIWGQAILRDAAGNVLLVCNLQSVPSGLPGDLAFNFGVPSGAPGSCSTSAGDVVGAGFPTTDQFVRARGQICLAPPGTPGSPIVDCSTPGAKAYNENLGANNVADALIIPGLNAFLAQPGFGGAATLQIDLRMGCNETGIGASDTYLNAVTPGPSAYINPDGNCPLGSITNNGFEQAFIVAGPAIRIPEPETLALFALGLVAMGWVTYRQRKA